MSLAELDACALLEIFNGCSPSRSHVPLSSINEVILVSYLQSFGGGELPPVGAEQLCLAKERWRPGGEREKGKLLSPLGVGGAPPLPVLLASTVTEQVAVSLELRIVLSLEVDAHLNAPFYRAHTRPVLLPVHPVHQRVTPG